MRVAIPIEVWHYPGPFWSEWVYGDLTIEESIVVPTEVSAGKLVLTSKILTLQSVPNYLFKEI